MSESFVRVTRRAVHSVKARGFHERAPAWATTPDVWLLMASWRLIHGWDW